jgi:hypothetical protein
LPEALKIALCHHRTLEVEVMEVEAEVMEVVEEVEVEVEVVNFLRGRRPINSSNIFDFIKVNKKKIA